VDVAKVILRNLSGEVVASLKFETNSRVIAQE
jgi:hypothetical protein